MTNIPLDRRAVGLLNKVRNDITHLRDDVAELWEHAANKTLPFAAKEISDRASNGLAAGGAYAASRIRHSLDRYLPRQRSSSNGLLTGALVMGVFAAGVYALLKNSQTGAGSRPATRPIGDASSRSTLPG
jgi:hypothetical protein